MRSAIACRAAESSRQIGFGRASPHSHRRVLPPGRRYRCSPRSRPLASRRGCPLPSSPRPLWPAAVPDEPVDAVDLAVALLRRELLGEAFDLPVNEAHAESRLKAERYGSPEGIVTEVVCRNCGLL